MTSLRFDGRVAIVTGAGAGLGRAYARLLAARGCAVVVNDLGCSPRGEGSSPSAADRVVEEIVADGGRAVASYTSIVEPQAGAFLLEAALRAFGRLDVVINNAGIHGSGVFGEQALEIFHLMMNVHYFGTLGICRAVWPHFKARGQGRIVNTVSAAVYGLPEHAAYGAAKGAVFGLTRSLARDGEALGIAVNAIAPGADTRMTRDSEVDPQLMDKLLAQARPELVAPVVAWLAHDDCPLMGEVLSAASGRVGRWLLGETEGVHSPTLLVEDVAGACDVLRSDRGFRPRASALDRSGQAAD